MGAARGNGFVPVVPRMEGVRTPTELGEFTTDSTGAATGIRIDCDRDGFIEFGGAFAQWQFAYAENSKVFFPVNPGELWPASSVGGIILKELSSGIGLGTVKPRAWPYESGFVRALTSGAQAQGTAGEKLAYNAAALANSKYGSTNIGRSSGRKTVVTWFGSVSAACTLTLSYSYDGTTWYDSSTTITLAGAADFAQDFLTAAPYVALKPSINLATLTAYISWR